MQVTTTIKSFIVQAQGLYYTIKHYRFVIYIEWAYFVISLGVFDCQFLLLEQIHQLTAESLHYGTPPIRLQPCIKY